MWALREGTKIVPPTKAYIRYQRMGAANMDTLIAGCVELGACPRDMTNRRCWARDVSSAKRRAQTSEKWTRSEATGLRDLGVVSSVGYVGRAVAVAVSVSVSELQAGNGELVRVDGWALASVCGSGTGRSGTSPARHACA